MRPFTRRLPATIGEVMQILLLALLFVACLPIFGAVAFVARPFLLVLLAAAFIWSLTGELGSDRHHRLRDGTRPR